jgi:hypothetical protein
MGVPQEIAAEADEDFQVTLLMSFFIKSEDNCRFTILWRGLFWATFLFQVLVPNHKQSPISCTIQNHLRNKEPLRYY